MPTINGDSVTLTLLEYYALLVDRSRLHALEMGGVCDWIGYKTALTTDYTDCGNFLEIKDKIFNQLFGKMPE